MIAWAAVRGTRLIGEDFMSERLRGKTTLITAAAQSIGRAIALARARGRRGDPHGHHDLASDESRFMTGQAVIIDGGIAL